MAPAAGAGQRYGQESGYSEVDVPRVIAEFRQERRGRQVERVTADSNIYISYISALNYGGKPQQLLDRARHGHKRARSCLPALRPVHWWGIPFLLSESSLP